MLNDRVVEVLVEQASQAIAVQIGNRQYEVETSRRGRPRREDDDRFIDGKWQLRSPLTGVVNEVRKHPGDVVEKDDVLLVVEAMKMLNELRARVPGKLSVINVAEGDRVELGMAILAVDEQT
jgi:biotin carboxyl carrier protein